MKRRLLLLAILVAFAVIIGVSVGGGQECQTFVAWDRQPGSLSAYPERVDETYEHVELLRCEGGMVRATVREVRLTRQEQFK